MAYRRFPSRHRWNTPVTPGWLGFTIAVRVTLVVALAWVILR